MNRLINLLLIAGIGVAVIASFAYLSLDLGELGSATSLKQMGAYVQRFLSPDLSAEYLKAIFHGSLETLAMSALGTLLAAVFGIVLALPAAGRFGWPLQSASRLLLNGLRAIPELVWAALMVLAAGLGPNAGTLALALHTTG
ncbi:PhnE/PtxC family ABC transporter permease, partial [Pseudomonas sp. HMWF006]|uniref:PhnE/PtxC family ABC transporter permease n=1 Tax=Pseudomonas sp. HMWF006 TaxID=2056843 RepID=UPI000D4079EA